MTRWPRIVLHADMDAFYASVEQLDNPELRGRPVLIGPNSYRGVVLTASYEARPFKVGSAMPVAEARRRCPQAIMVEPRFERYTEVSEQVMNIFGDFSPRVEAVSLDEAFLDMTGAEGIFGAPEAMGRELKGRVKEATGLNISVGVSGTKYVAKVASDHDKPNSLTIVPPETAKDWLAPQPVNKLWGVGAKTTPRLNAIGLMTIGDIARASPEWLSDKLGSAGRHYYELAHARDPRKVSRGRSARSMGSDRTLSEDVSKREDIVAHLRRSAERIARRMRTKDYVARGVRVRLKTTNFELLSRQRTLPRPVDTADALLAATVPLLSAFDHPGPFRLVGMAAFDLSWDGDPTQLDLFNAFQVKKPAERRERDASASNERLTRSAAQSVRDGTRRDLEQTLDALAEKFGGDVLVRASDLGRKRTVMKDGVNLDYLDYRDGERVSSPKSAGEKGDNGWLGDDI